jgi:CheY-like chemotaxis protein
MANRQTNSDLIRADSQKAALIMVVDDTEANRYTLTRYLERAGYSVVSATTGEEALRLVSEDTDLILLDIKLPDMLGFEVCTRLKADPRFRRIPLIHTSAFFTKGEDYLRGIEGGADAFLITPIDPLIL